MVARDNPGRRLQVERERLQHELQQLAAGYVPAGDLKDGSPFGKREEGAAEVSEFEKKLALRDRLQDALHDIEHALRKFEQGTYGLCDSCGQPIGEERLKALPQAVVCVSCKGRAKNAKSRSVPR